MGGKIEVTDELLKKAYTAGKLGMGQREAAALCGMSRSSFQRLIGNTSSEPHQGFSDAIEAGRSDLYSELAQVLIEDATINKNPDSCKFLLKGIFATHERYSEKAQTPAETNTPSPTINIMLTGAASDINTTGTTITVQQADEESYI